MIRGLVGILNNELYYRYQSSFSSKRWQERVLRKSVRRSPLAKMISTAAYSMIVGAMMALMVVIPSLYPPEGQPAESYLYPVVQTMVITVFFWSFLWIMDQSWLFQEHRLLEPLLPLPISTRTLQETFLLMLLLDICGLSMPFVALGVISAKPLLCLGYLGVTILVSVSVGLICGSVIATRGTGSTARRVASAALMVMLIVGIVLLSQIGSFIDWLSTPASVTFPGADWIYPMSFGRGLFSRSPIPLAPMVMQLVLGVLLYRWSFRRYWRRLVGESYEHRKAVRIRYRVTSPFTAMLIKDAKLMGREPRLMYSVFYLPIFVLLVYFTATEVYGSWITLASIAVLSGVFSYGFIQIDEKHNPLLSSLPLAYVDRLLPKALFSMAPMDAVFAVIAMLSMNVRAFTVPSLLSLSSTLICLNTMIMATPKTATALLRRTVMLTLFGLLALLWLSFFVIAFLLPFAYAPEVGAAITIPAVVAVCMNSARKQHSTSETQRI